jgi:hypothetical protein
VVHVVVDRARGVVVDLGAAVRTRSTRSTFRVGHVVVDRARGVVVDRARGEHMSLVCSVEERKRVLRRGYGRGCHCGPR